MMDTLRTCGRARCPDRAVSLGLALLGLLWCGPAGAQVASYPPIAEIRTASDTVLAVYLNSTNLSGPVWNTVFSTNEVDTSNPSLWQLNGEPVSAIDKFVTEAGGVDYHIYLHVPKLTNGMSYTLVTPHGMRSFVFDDARIPCESIKVNQSGYSALSHTRFANLAIWLGSGGSQPISSPLPTYTVFEQFTGHQVASGTVQAFGGGAQDASSGDYVYRIDLSNVPEGGPYRVSVSGYGCSYPFGVGGDFSRRLAYVAFRGLYYQRCGVPLVSPYAWTNIRPYPCHTNVYDTQAGFNSVPSSPGTAPALFVHGGYHDAGDSDRNAWHLMVPMVLMTTYEVFPNLFTDDQFNIPDRFDANFTVLGKGNGIPDILDEALWGAMIWTNLQSTPGEPPGAVGWGVNAPNNANPAWGINWDQDTLLYGTATNDVNSCGLAAGVFMNLARLMQPYNAALSGELQARADAAYTYAGTRGTLKKSHKLYYSIQKYLLTGDVASSNNIRALYGNVNSMVNTYNNEAGGYLTDGGMWLASYFMSYLIATNRPTDPTIVSALKGYLKAAADNQVNWNNSCAYPVGWPASVSVASHNFNQGGLTTQGQLAYPCLMQWALTGQQQYIDAVSQLMDYNQGLNPLGKCYMTGIGLDGVQHPHTRETAYCQVTMGWGGPLAGITVYGPVEPAKLGSSPGSVQVPPLSGLARERCYVDHLGFWAMDEFTVYQSEVFPAAVYAVLAQGGKWNTANEPFLNPSASIRTAGNSLTLTFGALPARKSYVQASSNVAGPWSDISGPLVPDSSGSIQFTAIAAAGTQFYRTRWSAPLY